jgi:hypothetical protein
MEVECNISFLTIPIAVWLSITVFSMIFGNAVDAEGVVIEGTTWSANLGGAELGIATLIALTAVAIAVGVTILGSGLSDVTVKTIILITAYVGIWGVLITLSLPLILEIETFGAIIDVVLTIFYVIGVFQAMASSTSGGGGD